MSERHLKALKNPTVSLFRVPGKVYRLVLGERMMKGINIDVGNEQGGRENFCPENMSSKIPREGYEMVYWFHRPRKSKKKKKAYGMYFRYLEWKNIICRVQVVL